MRGISGSLQIGRNVHHAELRPQLLTRPNDGLHFDEIDDTFEVGFLTDRNLNRHGVRRETVTHLGDCGFKIRARAIHLVDKGNARNLVLIGLPPNCFGLRLNPADRTEDSAGAVEHAQAALNFDGKVHMPGSINDIDAMFTPEAGGRGARDRDATFAFLFHPVHGRRTLVHFSDLVDFAGVKQNAFGRRRLAGVDVRADPDVAGALQRHQSLRRHFRLPLAWLFRLF